MASVVVNGDTSGAVTLTAPAVAGTVTVTLPSTTGTMAVLPTATGVLAESAGGTGTTTGYYGFKNRIINGAMVIDQRNAGASSTAQNSYTVDRFGYYGTQASKGTWGQNLGAVTPPTSFTNYLGFSSSSAYTVISSDRFSFYHIIEGYNIADLGWGTASAKSVTLSFQVYSSLTGTFGGSLANSAGTRCYPFSYSIPVANTWTTISITVAGDTAGTWLTNNGNGIGIQFGLGCGSANSGTAGAWGGTFYVSATGATSVVGTNGATFYITGVQLEKGSTATSFDYRPYGTELALCQRYAVMFGNSGDYYSNYGYGAAYATTNVSATVDLPVTMRAIPTVSFPGSGDFMFYRGTGNISTASANMAGGNPEGTTTVGAYYFVGTGLTAGTFGKVQSSNSIATRVLFSAEL